MDENITQKVSVLGCGWFGLPLAERLVQEGFVVYGSTTTPEKIPLLRSKNIIPFIIDLGLPASAEELIRFLESDLLVICFPPGLRAGKASLFIEQIKRLTQGLQNTSRLKQVLFISSTSVYKDVNRTVSENDSEALLKESPLICAEDLLLSGTNYKTIILRFGGLVGGNRHPGRFLAGKTEVSQPDAPVNLLHLDDCLEIACQLISGTSHQEVYNVVADEHPTRLKFYTAAATMLGLEPPKFKSGEEKMFKIIDNTKIRKALNYQFIHPDPMNFFNGILLPG